MMKRKIMNSLVILFQGVLLMSCTVHTSKAEIINWDVDAAYEITTEGINQAINDARDHFALSPNDTIILKIAAGRHLLDRNPNRISAAIGPIASITFGVNGFNTGPEGQLIIEGAGIDKTKLVFTDFLQHAFFGRNIHGLTLRKMHITRSRHTSTQGYVVATDTGSIDIDVQKGFPTPGVLWRNRNLGHYLRKATDDALDPQILLEDNKQIAYGFPNQVLTPPEKINKRVWRFYLTKTNLNPTHYEQGDFVAIKAKKVGFPYSFSRGSRLVFDEIKWTQSTRGIIRGGFSDILIEDCEIARPEPVNGQTSILSSSGGGIQINQPDDPVSRNIVIRKCTFDSTGDDNIALFHVDKVRLANIHSRNAFARSILVTDKATNVCTKNVVVENGIFEGIERTVPCAN